MKINPKFFRPLIISLVCSAALVGNAVLGADDAATKGSAAPPVTLSYELAQVLKMHESGISDNVLTAYVENSRYVVAAKAEEIVLLRDRGVPDSVILAAIQKAQNPVQPIAQPAPAYTPLPPSPSPSYAVVAPQPTVIYAQPSTVYVQPEPVYVPAPAVSVGFGFYDYGYRTFPFRPAYYGLGYGYSHYPRYSSGFGGVSVGFSFGGGRGYHHR